MKLDKANQTGHWRASDWAVLLACLLGTLWGLIKVATVSIKLDLTLWPF